MISARPDTHVLANVYQLYMVEYQCASMLISHNHGVVDMIVSANQIIYTAAHIVFFQIYLLPSSTVKGPLSASREIFLTLNPKILQSPIVRIVQMVKNGTFRNGFFPFKISSLLTASASVQW